MKPVLFLFYTEPAFFGSQATLWVAHSFQSKGK